MYLISKSSYSIIPHMRHCLSVRCGHVACIESGDLILPSCVSPLGSLEVSSLAVSLVYLTSRLLETSYSSSLCLSFMSRQLCSCPHHHIILCRLLRVLMSL